MFPDYTRKERLCDGAIHVLGVVASIVAFAALLSAVVPTGNLRSILVAAVYGGALVAMLGASAAYHMTSHPERKERIRKLDHAAIFVMIAGTYTPFALVGVGGRTGYGLAALVWGVAAFGVVLKMAWPRRFERAALVLYLALGWTGVVVARQLLAALPPTVMVLLAVGGVLYTIGIGFHLWRRMPYHNAIWHGFVLTAAGAHYAAVFSLVAAASG